MLEYRGYIISFLMVLLDLHRYQAFFSPWMRLIVYFCQMLKVQMGVNLCGADIAVTEQFLDCP